LIDNPTSTKNHIMWNTKMDFVKFNLIFHNIVKNCI